MQKINYKAAVRAAALNDDVVSVLSWLFDVPAEMVADDIESTMYQLEQRAKKRKERKPRRKK